MFNKKSETAKLINKIDRLNKQIAEAEAVLESLRTDRQLAITRKDYLEFVCKYVTWQDAAWYLYNRGVTYTDIVARLINAYNIGLLEEPFVLTYDQVYKCIKRRIKKEFPDAE